MSREVEDITSLTTDAIPQPPRDDPVNVEPSMEDQKFEESTVNNPSESSDESPSKTTILDDESYTVDENDGDTNYIPTPPRRKKKESCSSSQSKHKENNSAFIPNNATSNCNIVNIVNCQGVHYGAQFVYHVNGTKDVKSKDANQTKMSKSVIAVMACKDPCDRVYLEIVSKHLGSEWRDVFRRLDYSEGELDQFFENYMLTGKLKEVIYQILLDWVQNDPDTALVGRLGTVLWELDQKDVVVRMAAKWKEIMKMRKV